MALLLLRFYYKGNLLVTQPKGLATLVACHPSPQWLLSQVGNGKGRMEPQLGQLAIKGKPSSIAAEDYPIQIYSKYTPNITIQI